MKTILHRFTRMLWADRPSDTRSAERLYASLRPANTPDTFCWEDLDYTDQTRSFWQPAQHYARMQAVLKGFGEERLYRDGDYAARMIGALKYWLDHDYRNPNWWHNEIGMPLGIGNITILLYPLLDADTVDRAAALVGRGSMATLPAISQSWTGANLIWGALNTVRHALVTTVDQCRLAEDPEITDRAAVHNGIRYTALDGTVLDTAIREQVGSWRRNNAALSDRPVKGDVLTLTVTHPAGRESAYAYMISAAERDEPTVEILRNDRGLQAIRLPDGSVMAVFYGDASLSAGPDGEVLSGTEGQILC